MLSLIEVQILFTLLQADLAVRLAEILPTLSEKVMTRLAWLSAKPGLSQVLRNCIFTVNIAVHLLQVAFLYFTVFLSTMRREWFGIDRLRLDKFMMLVRKFVRALFQYLQAQQW